MERQLKVQRLISGEKIFGSFTQITSRGVEDALPRCDYNTSRESLGKPESSLGALSFSDTTSTPPSLRGALGALERIWVGRRSGVVVNRQESLLKVRKGDGDWIGDLRGRGIDWLIL